MASSVEKSTPAVVWYFLSQYKRQFAIIVALSLLVGAMDAASVAAVYPLLVHAIGEEGGGHGIILSVYGALAGLLPVDDPFVAYAMVFLVTAITAFLVRVFFIFYRTAFTAHVVRTRQQDLFERYINADYRFLTNQRQGELVYNVGRAPQALSDLIVALAGIISETMLSISIFAFLLSLSWQVTLVVIAVAGAYLYITRLVGRRVSYESAKGELEAIREFNVILNEVFTGILHVKVFNTMGYWSRSFHRSISNRWMHFRRRTRAVELPNPSLLFVIYASVGLGAIVMRLLFPVDVIEWIPIFGAFAFALFRLVPVGAKASGLMMNAMATLPDCELYYGILHQDIREAGDGDEKLESLDSDVRFENVSFTYENGTKAARNVSVVFEKGKTTALVGQSGSGKSTVLSLLLRLFDPQEGTITIGGKDIRQYRRASLMAKVGYVSQDAFALNDTVRGNILFGRDYSDEEVVQAAKHANAHDFVTSLPEGYETFVGDRGVRLSSGQRQRLALARAIIGQPELYIFDEATNALDSPSESAVQQAIRDLSETHTVILVAHRLSTIVDADKIVVFREGMVVEEGTHAELMARNGAYWRLYRSQAAGAEAEEKGQSTSPISRA